MPFSGNSTQRGWEDQGRDGSSFVDTVRQGKVSPAFFCLQIRKKKPSWRSSAKPKRLNMNEKSWRRESQIRWEWLHSWDWKILLTPQANGNVVLLLGRTTHESRIFWSASWAKQRSSWDAVAAVAPDSNAEEVQHVRRKVSDQGRVFCSSHPNASFHMGVS